jgi:hypothetical protein
MNRATKAVPVNGCSDGGAGVAIACSVESNVRFSALKFCFAVGTRLSASGLVDSSGRCANAGRDRQKQRGVEIIASGSVQKQPVGASQLATASQRR